VGAVEVPPQPGVLAVAVKGVQPGITLGAALRLDRPRFRPLEPVAVRPGVGPRVWRGGRRTPPRGRGLRPGRPRRRRLRFGPADGVDAEAPLVFRRGRVVTGLVAEAVFLEGDFLQGGRVRAEGGEKTLVM